MAETALKQETSLGPSKTRASPGKPLDPIPVPTFYQTSSCTRQFTIWKQSGHGWTQHSPFLSVAVVEWHTPAHAAPGRAGSALHPCPPLGRCFPYPTSSQALRSRLCRSSPGHGEGLCNWCITSGRTARAPTAGSCQPGQPGAPGHKQGTARPKPGCRALAHHLPVPPQSTPPRPAQPEEELPAGRQRLPRAREQQGHPDLLL